MEIVDARHAFLKRNKNCLGIFLRSLPAAQSAAVQLLPLIFHADSRLLPAYNGPETPHGIYGYAPEKQVIGLARKFNSRFHLDPAPVLNNAPIEALYFKYSVVQGRMSLWLVHAEDLKPAHQSLLEDKLHRAGAWLRSRNMEVQTHLVTARQLAQQGLGRKKQEFYASTGLFLDAFYSESFLLAGKYPVWWLIPPELEDHYADFVDKIRVARFVNEQEYLDLGSLGAYSPHDLMQQVMDCVHDVQQSPQTSWPKLLVLNLMQKYWPKIDGVAVRLKKHVYLDDLHKEATTGNMLQELLRESLQDLQQADRTLSVDKLLDMLQQSGSSGEVLGSLVNRPSQQILHLRPQAFDAMCFIQGSRALMYEIGLVFTRLVSRYKHHAEDEAAQKQLALAQNMRVFLSESAQRVPIFITRPDPGLLQGRMIFRHLIQPQENWLLVVELDDEQEKILYDSPSLLALIAWAWLNRIADQSTQVAVECPLRAVRQIDARHALEVVVAQLDRDKIIATSRDVFTRTREMQSALVMIHLNMDESLREQIEALMEKNRDDTCAGFLQVESLIGHCEQLVISNWGEVQVQRFAGEAGILQCLCDWLMCCMALPRPRSLPLMAHGYAAGASTYFAQRTNEIYAEMAAFFLKKRNHPGRFIVRIGQHYYCVSKQDHGFEISLLGNEAELLQFLELPNSQYMETCIDRMSMLAMPLREIYQRNRPDAVQLFFRVGNRTCDTWILDEKGSLCHFRQDWYERDSYLTRWLYLLRNIRTRLKNINYQNRELPPLELVQLGNNRLGEIEFTRLGSDDFRTSRAFIDMQLKVESVNKTDRLDIFCDNRVYDYKTHGDAVLPEFLQYANARMIGEGRKPIYVTDVDVPLRLFNVEDRDAIQTLHFLKYVRNFESRIIQLMA